MKTSKIAEQLKIMQATNKNHVRLEELEERNKKLEEQTSLLWQVLESTMKALEEKSETRKAKMNQIRAIIMRERARAKELKRKNAPDATH